MASEVDLSKLGPEFLKMVGRHLGCLGITYFLQKNGRDDGDVKAVSYSGFFVQIEESWYFCTAGHVFDDEEEGLETLRAKGHIRIDGAQLLGCFGSDAKNTHPTIIDYESMPKVIIDRPKTRGLDFAILPLRDLYKWGLESNGVCPFKPENWMPISEGKVVASGILGFPNELKKDSGGHEIVMGWIRPVFVWVKPCALPNEAPKPDYELFSAELPANSVNSPVGLSGGPVLAIVRMNDGSANYTLIGVQSFWTRSSRIVYACPMVSFFDYVQDEINKMQNET